MTFLQQIQDEHRARQVRFGLAPQRRPVVLQRTVPAEPVATPAWANYELPFPTVRRIIRRVGRQYGVSLIDMLSARRTAKVVLPRQIAMYLAKTLTQGSFPEIGRRFGGRDHTTIMHAVTKIEGLRATDPELDEQIIKLIAEFSRKDEGA